MHTRSIARAPVGIDLRYPWAETVEIAASGALDEFARKKVRNDYPLMALWEMGIRRLRVPVHDVADEKTRMRMRVMRRMGHEFTAYAFGVPRDDLRQVLLDHADLVAALEVIAPWHSMSASFAQIRELKAASTFAVYLSRLRRHNDEYHHGERSRHVIEHGFLPQEEQQIGELLRKEGAREALDGLLFRVSRERSPWDEIAAIERMGHDLDTRGCAYVRLACDNPAEAADSDLANANRVAEAIMAAFAHGDLPVWLDTFNDVDRGYFPRTGLVDRRYNPRASGHVCRHLHGLLSSTATRLRARDARNVPGGRVLTMTGARTAWALALPEREMRIAFLPWTVPERPPRMDARSTDLVSGEIRTLTGGLLERDGAPAVAIAHPPVCRAPTLFSLDFER